ncbi:DUF2946 family protein [Nisaea acidiphila]|uniref:DUF2946 family protein n=1 Tax=Nisaea acidiphila TaxID=1862145 RepID=A0A9J7ALY8_9PROT|nr:DUF2946 family protein [Nisaea acidiphila]UUX48488.1 DUF2946 family protein [Nisaea acidiphila]
MRCVSAHSRTVLARLLVLCLTLQLLVPTLFASYQVAGSVEAAGDPFRTAIICTPKGLVQISLDENGNIVTEGDEAPTSAARPDCIYCSLAGGVLAPQNLLPVAELTATALPLVRFTEPERPRTPHFASSLRARAPPNLTA